MLSLIKSIKVHVYVLGSSTDTSNCDHICTAQKKCSARVDKLVHLHRRCGRDAMSGSPPPARLRRLLAYDYADQLIQVRNLDLFD
jgi:hypothetical protein